MGTLADRLRTIVGGTDGRRPSAVPRIGSDLARGMALAPAGAGVPEAAARRAAGVLGGAWVERADGGVLVVERMYARDHRYGRTSIGEIVDVLTAGHDAIGTLDRRWPGAPAGEEGRGLLLLDLETTGLAGGAGTRAFLVGGASVGPDGIHVRQFLLPGYEHELALLAEVAAWAEGEGGSPPGTGCTPGLVTFNGRTFDVPLIETRYLYHRLPFPLAEVPHIDMLPAARRLWRVRPGAHAMADAGEGCRLTTLERYMGGVHRVRDVPGFEIPSRYFGFVRDGDPRPLEAVLEHNRLDLLSLALVMARAIRLVTSGPAEASHPWEALGLGRLYERADRREEAEASYAWAAEQARRAGSVAGTARAESLRRLALCRRRAGRLHEAALAWEALLEGPAVPAALRYEAREALAVHYEHRAKDLTSARRLVLDALAEDSTASRRRAVAHRLRRLERKIGVRSEGGLIAALDAADC